MITVDLNSFYYLQLNYPTGEVESGFTVSANQNFIPLIFGVAL